MVRTQTYTQVVVLAIKNDKFRVSQVVLLRKKTNNFIKEQHETGLGFITRNFTTHLPVDCKQQPSLWWGAFYNYYSPCPWRGGEGQLLQEGREAG